MSNVLLTCSRTENSADFIPRSLRFNRIPSKNLIFNQLDVEMTDYITFCFFSLTVLTPSCLQVMISNYSRVVPPFFFSPHQFLLSPQMDNSDNFFPWPTHKSYHKHFLSLWVFCTETPLYGKVTKWGNSCVDWKHSSDILLAPAPLKSAPKII